MSVVEIDQRTGGAKEHTPVTNRQNRRNLLRRLASGLQIAHRNVAVMPVWTTWHHSANLPPTCVGFVLSGSLWKGVVVGLVGCLVAASGAYADHARFHVEGNKLFYNTDIPRADAAGDDIVHEDAEELALYVMDVPLIDTVVVESRGGSSRAALLMAETIERFGLKTEVLNGCYSACPVIFLAGEPRVLASGGVLGFHRSSVDAAELALIFEARKSKTSFAHFFTLVYDQAITTVSETYTYMLQRGVHSDFILQVMGTPAREMLYPSRQELISAGVIDE